MKRIFTVLTSLMVCSLHAAIYYVDAARPDDSGGGLTWGTAKKTIQAAVNVSVGGDSIIVTNGVYNPITTANKAITIQSVNGSEFTIIDGGNSQRCATLGSADGETNSVLTGITLRNGRVELINAKGGGALYGSLNRCVITNNQIIAVKEYQDIGYGYFSAHANSFGGGVFGSSLDRCIVVGNLAYASSEYGNWNYASASGGGTYNSNLKNCLVVNNTAHANSSGYYLGSPTAQGGGSFGGTQANSLVSKNNLISIVVGGSSASPIVRGYGVYNSALMNSIVWGNSGENYNSSTFANSCTTPLPAGMGNISADPLFVDFANNNFRLQSTSPCINTGANGSVQTTTDLDGNPRIIDSLVDMGAYESLGPYAVNFNAQGGTVPAPSSIMVTNTFSYGPLATTTKAGYIFGGWYTNELYTGSEITAASIVTLPSAHTLYAKWTLDPYYVVGGANATPVGITTAVNADAAHSGDGLNSLKLGGIGLLTDGQMAGIQCSATGPGILAFDWKVSSETNYDWLRFYEEGGATTNKISGNIDWAHISVTVTGAVDLVHTFRWEYEKDPISDAVGEDCGWVDAITWSPLYTMTVNNGSGDGYYTNNAYASITADAAATHYEFDRWTGDTNTVANIFAASTTLRMPNTNATITAIYKPILYTLSAVNAIGGGSYPYGTTVEIRASAFENKRFYRWTGDVGSVADVNAATTTVVTSDQTTSLTATYTVPLTVNSGSGSGWYPEGSPASVSADADPMWKEFNVWTGDSGLLSNANARTTALTLPTGPATVTATYRDSISRLTGSYGRTYSTAGTANATTPDATAGSPSGTPAVKLGGTGVIPDNGYAAFETVVSGAGWVYFQWKVSSELDGDYLKFKVDGSEIAAISGTKGPWTQVSNRVDTAGSHTLRWEYIKNSSISSSTDAGWVDDIIWIGDIPDPVITPDIQTANLDTNLLTLSFLGERGIPYTIYSNSTLSAFGWEPTDIEPQEMGETNGLFRYEFLHAVSLSSCFFRIGAGPMIPAGMVLVPAGVNSGVDPDFGAYSLTADAFLMDMVEVTGELWNEIKDWSGGNGYAYDNVGSSRAQNHPVQTVNWYDIVKWCNARSQKEGREPVYYTDAGYSIIYKTDRVTDPYIKPSANGYRLPTAIEWEYAARGGALGRRFPWGDSNEIQHTRANYNSLTNQVYDTSLTRGTHPLYNGTSPVGSFRANDYGLYDMVGNVWEWCWDWYPGSEGSGRTLHGGSWTTHADYCRNAKSYNPAPFYADGGMGFRTVICLPQP